MIQRSQFLAVGSRLSDEMGYVLRMRHGLRALLVLQRTSRTLDLVRQMHALASDLLDCECFLASTRMGIGARSSHHPLSRCPFQPSSQAVTIPPVGGW